MTRRLGLIGARGFAGAELISLLAGHDAIVLAYAASRALAGHPARRLSPKAPGDLTITMPSPEAAADQGLDAYVLAMPNGAAGPYAEAIAAKSPSAVIVDLSADHRFVPGWTYGLPEHRRDEIGAAKHIANPGCYATAAALMVHPLADLIDGPASVFGVSGFSGAGTSRGPRNDPERLGGNVAPYALAGHGHEGEIRAHTGVTVQFTPNVADYFRGIIATAHIPLARSVLPHMISEAYHAAYAAEPLIAMKAEPAEVRDGVGHDGAVLGAPLIVPEERRLVVTCALDNLRKGAASQALQNLNITLGFEEFTGLTAPADHTAAPVDA